MAVADTLASSKKEECKVQNDVKYVAIHKLRPMCIGLQLLGVEIQSEIEDVQ